MDSNKVMVLYSGFDEELKIIEKFKKFGVHQQVQPPFHQLALVRLVTIMPSWPQARAVRVHKWLPRHFAFYIK